MITGTRPGAVVTSRIRAVRERAECGHPLARPTIQTAMYIDGGLMVPRLGIFAFRSSDVPRRSCGQSAQRDVISVGRLW